MSNHVDIKEGPVARYRYDSVVFTTPDALHMIYESSSNVQKAHRYGVWPKKAESPQTFSCVDKRLHARMRRILNAAIADNAVRSASEFVIAHADRWLELSSEREGEWSKSRNMTTWADCLQFDIMAELCFGKSFGAKEPGQNQFRSIPNSISEFMWLTYRVSRFFAW
jgi:cytochrome P450